ncbi:hypothetical protein TWF706_010549 [Orbilia oligospora]|nr:hypothetical protein TWF706_010549 [Orbilia oligospora]
MVVVEREWRDELNASMHVISGWLSAGRLSLLLFAGDEGHSSESGGFAQRDIARGCRARWLQILMIPAIWLFFFSQKQCFYNSLIRYYRYCVHSASIGMMEVCPCGEASPNSLVLFFPCPLPLPCLASNSNLKGPIAR